MTKLLVTGASGFVGGAVARDAIARGETVLALSRSAQSDEVVEALGAEPVRGNLASLTAGELPPCDQVVHCAARVEAWGHREDFWRINVEGTERMLAAAAAAGASRFVHMSTEAVLWYGQPLRNIDETYPYPAKTPILYSETKAAAERRVLEANREGFTTLALRPRFVWGPGDQTLAPGIKNMVEQGTFVWLDGGRAVTSTTHIANLVHATRLALEKGRGGETYFVTDDETTDFRSFVTKMMAAQGVEMPSRALPSALVRPIAAGLESVWRALGIQSEPPLTRHAAGVMACECTLRIDKAKRELGYHPLLSVAEGLADLPDS